MLSVCLFASNRRPTQPLGVPPTYFFSPKKTTFHKDGDATLKPPLSGEKPAFPHAEVLP